MICQPTDVIAQMWYRWDVWDEEVIWRVGIAWNAVFFFHSFVASPARKVSSFFKNGRVRRIGCQRCRQNLHHAVATERFLQQRPPCCAFGTLFEVQVRKLCTTLQHQSGLEVKIFKNWEFRRTLWSSSLRFAPRCGAVWASLRAPSNASLRAPPKLLASGPLNCHCL